jgi:cytochrome c oxidase subunit I+III
VWNAGTLEWVGRIPADAWGLRSIPWIHSRYPIWDDKKLFETIDSGEGLLADAKEGKRETLVTGVLDAQPLQVLRVPGPSWIPALTAVCLGGTFIFPVFKLWIPTFASLVLYLVAQIYWLWTSAAVIPEKKTKEVAVGKRLPLYVSGVRSTGWWAMFITMTGDLTGFLSVLFGYFFFWTIHSDFPPPGIEGPGWQWPLLAGLLTIATWGTTLGARLFNARGQITMARVMLGTSILLAVLTAGAFFLGPWTTGLDPTAHAYPAIVWALATWIIIHLIVGVIMQGYCLARSVFGRMTSEYDADIWNVTLYWHFAGFCALLTALVIGGFPLLQ